MILKRWLFSLLVAALLLGFALSETAIAQTAESRTTVSRAGSATWTGFWNLRLQQKKFEDDFNQQKDITEFRLLADLNYRPLEAFHFHLAPQFKSATGSLQTQEVQSASQSEWGVTEASANLQVLSWLQISAGVLDQESDHPALLLNEQSFAALRLRAQSPPKETWSGGLTLESAIPTSSSLSTRTQSFEKPPTFASGSLNGGWRNRIFEGKLRAGFYQFQNLPQSVATESTYLGNTTFSTNDGTDAHFTYSYEGPFTSGELKAALNARLRANLKVEWVKNTKAPQGLNQASRSELSGEWDLNRSLQLQPFYEFFRSEPDAAVARYNGNWLNTNRVGYQAGLGFSYKNILKLSLAAGERDVVYASPFQQRERTWNLKLETSDASI